MALHYRGLLVWQRAMDLVERSYELARSMPNSERFGLVGQMQRAAVSIPVNIAEGHERRSRKEFKRFVSIAMGSLAELETLFDLAVRLKFVGGTSVSSARALADEVGRMLNAIHRSLNTPHIGERDSDELPDAALV